MIFLPILCKYPLLVARNCWCGQVGAVKTKAQDRTVISHVLHTKLAYIEFHIDPLSVMVHFNFNLSKLNTIIFLYFALILVQHHMPLSVLSYFSKLLTISMENLNDVDQGLSLHISILNVTSLSFPCYS